jgi:hypothetical protein
MPKTKKNIKVRDLKPNKDAKGGRQAVAGHTVAGHTTSSRGVDSRGMDSRGMDSQRNG